MKITAEPRSDQWNADDFTGGPRTFTVKGVIEGKAEQKYDIELEGEQRVWRPPLTMLRVLMELWGDDATVWIGRRVTLYLDPTVRFGKDTPGGVRISHMSDIGDKPRTVKITVSRGRKAPYTVQPLKEASKAAPAVTGEIPQDVIDNATKAKKDGALDQYVQYLTERGAPEFIIEYARSI